MKTIDAVSITAAVRSEITSRFSTLSPMTYGIYGLSDISVEVAKELDRQNIPCVFISDDFKGKRFKHWNVISSSSIPSSIRTVFVVCKSNKFQIIESELPDISVLNRSIVHFYPQTLEAPCDFVSYPSLIQAKALIDKHDVISFDLFGTLIIRNLFYDNSAFRILDAGIEKLGKSGFWDLRKVNEGSFLFDDPTKLTERKIYQSIVKQRPDLKIALAKLPTEFDLDSKFWSVNHQIVELITYAASKKKKILITSDTFYTKPQLRRFVGKYLPKNVNLLISNELGLSKSSGEFYSWIKKKYGSSVVHFGDSRHADVTSATSQGVTAALIKNPTDITQCPKGSEIKALRKNTLDEYVLSCVNRLVESHSTTPVIDNEEDLASVLFSPILYNYFKWLTTKLLNMKITHVMFCAREGYFMQRLFNAYVKSQGLTHIAKNQPYLKCSRNIALLGGIHRRADIYRTFTLHRYEGSLYNLLRHRMQIPAKFLMDNLKDIFIDTRKDGWEEALTSFEAIILKRAEELRKNYSNYLRKLIKNKGENVAIVDQGAAGSVQKFIGSLIKNKVHGTYVCFYPHNPHGHKSYHGMIDVSDSAFFKVNHIFESILTAPTGSYVWCRKNGSFGTGKKFTNQMKFSFRNKVMKKVVEDMKLFALIEGIEQPRGKFTISQEIIENIFERISKKEIVFGSQVESSLYFDNELVRPLSEHKIT